MRVSFVLSANWASGPPGCGSPLRTDHYIAWSRSGKALWWPDGIRKEGRKKIWNDRLSPVSYRQ
jgi:hypothetical protein